MLEWDDLLDGHLVAGDGVGGGGHHAVRALAQELKVVVPGANLKMSVSVSFNVSQTLGKMFYTTLCKPSP